MNLFYTSFILNFFIFIFLNDYIKIKKIPYVSTLNAAAEFIDIIILYLDSGNNIYQSFTQAAKFCLNIQLKKNATKTLIIYSMGCSLKESLQLSLNKDNNPFYNEIIEGILLSLKLGTPLKENLLQMSLSMRIRSKLSLEETMSKAPVKMIFPLVFFIFPVIFILLGSGFIQDFISTMGF